MVSARILACQRQLALGLGGGGSRWLDSVSVFVPSGSPALGENTGLSWLVRVTGVGTGYPGSRTIVDREA